MIIHLQIHMSCKSLGAAVPLRGSSTSLATQEEH